MDLDNLENMTVANLKKELKSRNMSVTGNKSELILRLTSSFSPDAIKKPEAMPAAQISLQPEMQTILVPNIPKPDTAPKYPSVTNVETVVKPVEPQAQKVEIVVVPKSKPTMDDVDQELSDNLIAGKKSIDELDEEERKRERSKKFHTPYIQSQEARALRFGTSAGVKAPDNETLKKRADRFGIDTSSKVSSTKTTNDPNLSEKLKQRAERFGIKETNMAAKVSLSTITASIGSAESKKPKEESLLKSKERFDGVASIENDDSSVSAKRLARAERFGLKT